MTRFNTTSLSLQQAIFDILSVVKLYEFLLGCILTTRENYDEMEERVKELVSEHEYVSENTRVRIWKHMFDEANTPDVEMSARDIDSLESKHLMWLLILWLPNCVNDSFHIWT